MITDERLNTLERDAEIRGSHLIIELVAEIRRLRDALRDCLDGGSFKHPQIRENAEKAFNAILDSEPRNIPALRELLTDPLAGTPDGVVG